MQKKLNEGNVIFGQTGFKWEENKDLIYEHFDEDYVTYNDHTAPGKHQPLLVAIDDVVEDKELADELINNCWVQEQWSASITPKGGFCEVAASLDYLLDGPGGVPIEKGWWKQSLDAFKNQMATSCRKCSAPIPLPHESDGFGGRTGPTKDTISKSNYEILKERSLKVQKGNYKILNTKFTNEDIIKIHFLGHLQGTEILFHIALKTVVNIVSLVPRQK